MASQYPSAPRRFERSRNDRVLGGVCGGAARYLNMDPTLVRILTAVLTLFTGIPIVVYIVLLFVLPEERVPDPRQVRPYQPQAYDHRPQYTDDLSQPRHPDPVWGQAPAPWEQPLPPSAPRPDTDRR